MAFPQKEGIYHISPDANELRSLLEDRHEEIAAFIVEPLLQGAGGMRMYDVSFLEEARSICDDYNILLIFDEVALKSIEIFEREDYMSKIKWIESMLREIFKDFYSDKVKEVRILGACLCIEVYDSGDLKGFKEFALEHGIHSRPFIKYMYGMFPYIIGEEELVKVCSVYKKWFDQK